MTSKTTLKVQGDSTLLLSVVLSIDTTTTKIILSDSPVLQIKANFSFGQGVVNIMTVISVSGRDYPINQIRENTEIYALGMGVNDFIKNEIRGVYKIVHRHFKKQITKVKKLTTKSLEGLLNNIERGLSVYDGEDYARMLAHTDFGFVSMVIAGDYTANESYAKLYPVAKDSNYYIRATLTGVHSPFDEYQVFADYLNSKGANYGRLDLARALQLDYPDFYEAVVIAMRSQTRMAYGKYLETVYADATEQANTLSWGEIEIR